MCLLVLCTWRDSNGRYASAQCVCASVTTREVYACVSRAVFQHVKTNRKIATEAEGNIIEKGHEA